MTDEVDEKARQLVARLNHMLDRLGPAERMDKADHPTAPPTKDKTPFDCALCLKPIFAGQRITQRGISQKRWVHTICWEA